MPRKRLLSRIDDIADAGTDVFARRGFAPARIGEIAQIARVGLGTVYLYAEGKEALFDLALRRAFE
ncbi:MAG: TetR/AcrR family transcriptional regulator, partial [Gemmatimonadales bacterium]